MRFSKSKFYCSLVYWETYKHKIVDCSFIDSFEINLGAKMCVRTK